MKTTRWFIERDTFDKDWIDSVYNPPEGLDSEEAAANLIANMSRKLCKYRVDSREVEVAAKNVVKIVSRGVVLEINDADWRRKEAGQEIQWLHFGNDDDGIIEAYYSPDGKNWHHNYSGKGDDCGEPEVEQIWREYNE